MTEIKRTMQRCRGMLLAAAFVLLGSTLALALPPGGVAPSVRTNLLDQAKKARAGNGGEPCATQLLHQGPTFTGLPKASLKYGGSIRGLVGGRNYTYADVDLAEVPFFTPINGPGLTPLLHDGGEWPGTNGNTATDDGRSGGSSSWAGEFYDLDNNGHYPKAVLRYIGQHCYIFVPMMYFPTLPRGIDINEALLPAAEVSWGLYWPDSDGMGQRIYYAPGTTNQKVIEPRFVLGADKATARLNLKAMADEFDSNIYPKMREWFGDEPDIDGDSKVFILLDDIRDGQGTYRGYFYAVNEFSRSVYPLSNEKELLHIDIFPSYTNAPQQTYGTIAHEFVHMIHFNMGTQIVGGQLEGEETWLEEGMTQFGQYIYNKIHTSNIDSFITHPQTVLVDDRQSTWSGSSPFANYGASYAFMFYLIEKFGGGISGGQRFMRNLVADKAVGIESVNNLLKSQNVTFSDVFSNWVICNILDRSRKLDGSPLADGLWGYAQDNDYDTTNNMGYSQRFPVKFTENAILGVNGTARQGTLYPWTADYISVTGNSGNLTLGFDGFDGIHFRCGVIKYGKDVDPAVDYLYLNDKQAGNLYIPNYGVGNPYEKLILVPSIQEGGGSIHEGNNFNPLPPPEVGSVRGARKAPIYGSYSYIWSATFNNLKVGIFPNPVYENELMIVVRTTDKFSSTPRLQMTFNGEQGYLTMNAVNDSTYISNYHVKSSGEGVIEAHGTNSNGVILTNTLKFSAVYYPPKSEGFLMASFANLRVPAGALRKGGMVILAAPDTQPSPTTVSRIGPALELTLPESETAAGLPLSVARVLATNASSTGLFQWIDGTARFVAPAEVGPASLTAPVTRPGTYFFATDRDAPQLGAEATAIDENHISIVLQDAGAGIDPATLHVQIDGRPAPATYDAATGRVVIETRNLAEGNYPVHVAAADRLGNPVAGTIRAQVTGTFWTQSFNAFPSPARAFTILRARFAGTGATQLYVDMTIRDSSGAEVVSTSRVPHRGNGEYDFRWDLRNGDGAHVANGVYYAEFVAYGSADGEVKQRTRFAVLR